MLVVALDGRRYGLDADVGRIVRMVGVTPLPGAPDVVEGVIDVAAVIVPVVDPRVRFGLERRPPSPDDHLVITRSDERTLAVRVDRAVAYVAVGALEPVAGEVAGGRHIAGVSRTAEGLLVITDLDAFLSLEEEAALNSALEAAQR